MESFKVNSNKLGARAGTLFLPHGNVETPFFMPIATRGAVRVASFDALEKLGAQIILSNTYHLVSRPGTELIEKQGGLHNFIGWKKPILTDSGGFQIFSLAESRHVDEDGVSFRSPIDGQKIKLTPESVIEAQQKFGSDISMVLDELCALPNSLENLSLAVDRTTEWAGRAKEKFSQSNSVPGNLLFGIVQGGVDGNLRERSAKGLQDIGFDGYAIGGLSVGEESEEMYKTVEMVTPLLPKDKPRYLMGVGQPHDIVEAVRRGVDMFDCVLPTRNARHGMLYVGLNKEYLKNILNSPLSEKVNEDLLFQKVQIRNNQYFNDGRLINEENPLLKGVTYSYLRYLFQIGEPMALYLATINNLWFYLNLMKEIRKQITSS